MANLKNYTITWYKEVLVGENLTNEPVILESLGIGNGIIGSHTMKTKWRAFSPKLKTNTNGTNELTFQVYTKYRDNGEFIANPLVTNLINESKLKLDYNGKEYWFIVKNTKVDSNNKTYSITATDAHIAELSRNGYDVTLDVNFMNNTGTVTELGEKILADSGWTIDVEESHELTELAEELLVKLEHITDKTTIYAFISCCKNQSANFQYYTSDNLPEVENDNGARKLNEEALITTTERPNYVTSNQASLVGIYFPIGYKYIEITDIIAERPVWTHRSHYNPVLDKIVYQYQDTIIKDGKEETFDVEGYVVNKVFSPDLIQSVVTNNTFKTTEGWTGQYFADDVDEVGNSVNNKKEKFAPKVEVKTNPDILIDMQNGELSVEKTYTPYLRATFPAINLGEEEGKVRPVLINSGFYDFRHSIKRLITGDEYVFYWKQKTDLNFRVDVGIGDYRLATNHYYNDENKKPNIDTYFSFSTKDNKEIGTHGDYKYIILTAKEGEEISLSEKEYQDLKIQFFIRPDIETDDYHQEQILEFYDFQCFPFIPNPDPDDSDEFIEFVKPEDQLQEGRAAYITTDYFYYRVDDNKNLTNAAEYKYYRTSSTALNLRPVYTTEKTRSVTVKQSNYYNAIQSLCEAFECWAEFDAANKKVIFKKYIGNDNHVGFKYGVNLKSSNRTYDSKSITTKLIVADNTNTHAQNGFCTITRAGANPTQDNCIYNFDYYLNKQLIDEALYLKAQAYYEELREINAQLISINDLIAALAVPLAKAQSQLQVASLGVLESEEAFQDAVNTFAKKAGFDYTEINTTSGDTEKLDKLKTESIAKTYYQISELWLANQQYQKDKEIAEDNLNQYQARYDNHCLTQNRLIKEKSELNKEFAQLFGRFIQEGTWNNNDYNDHEKYYLEALKVSRESAMPKVTYSFSVMDLENQEGYESFTFELGDKTWVEDVEAFGYDLQGNPVREDIIITEITYDLDDPSKNNIKVQNYSDQFKDLFQKITATTQQVKNSQGSWEKAGSFMDADASSRARFLQSALNDAEMVLQNAADQTVVWDNTGITITDTVTPSRQLRMVGGAILLRDEDGGRDWKTGLTSKGICANLITSGQVDTGVIQIMNGDQPYFRWDDLGITAYSWESGVVDKNYRYNFDTKSGVRFDRFGIYGYKDKTGKDAEGKSDGSLWAPTQLSEITDPDNGATFALTWDGLFLNVGSGTYTKGGPRAGVDTNPIILANPIWHESSSRIGRTNGLLYNAWDEFGLPYYDTSEKAKGNQVFTKILTVGGEGENEQLAIYDDGTLTTNNIKLTGGIEWTEASSPSKSVYGDKTMGTKSKPADGTRYNSENFPDSDDPDKNPVWHKICGQDDVFYCHTDNGGATWQGPIALTGKSIVDTEIQYYITNNLELTATEISKIEDEYWISGMEGIGVSEGQAVWTRIRDVYNSGTWSSWRYSVSYNGINGITFNISGCPNELTRKNIIDNPTLWPNDFTLSASKQKANGGLEEAAGWWYYGIKPINITEFQSLIELSEAYIEERDGYMFWGDFAIFDNEEVAFQSSTIDWEEGGTMSAIIDNKLYCDRDMTFYIVSEKVLDNMYQLELPNQPIVCYDENDYGFTDDISLVLQTKSIEFLGYRTTDDYAKNWHVYKFICRVPIVSNTYEDWETGELVDYSSQYVKTNGWLSSSIEAIFKHNLNSQFLINQTIDSQVDIQLNQLLNNIDISIKNIDQIQFYYYLNKPESFDSKSVWTSAVRLLDDSTAITCYIESNQGTFFNEQNLNVTVELSAKIMQGETEIDPTGRNLSYQWLDESGQIFRFYGKTISLTAKELANYKAIYFIASKR